MTQLAAWTQPTPDARVRRGSAAEYILCLSQVVGALMPTLEYPGENSSVIWLQEQPEDGPGAWPWILAWTGLIIAWGPDTHLNTYYLLTSFLDS